MSVVIGYESGREVFEKVHINAFDARRQDGELVVGTLGPGPHSGDDSDWTSVKRRYRWECVAYYSESES